MKFMDNSLAAVLVMLAAGLNADMAHANSLNVSGYLREHVSVNLGNTPETAEDDKYDISMARTTLRLDLDGEIGPFSYHIVGRASREIRTSYLDRLEDLGGGSGRLMDHYDEEEIREAVLEYKPNSNVTFRFGKQQVAWGETDFFQGMDIVHGFDYTWRSFLEPENEELRKPLIMLNTIIQVPSADGALQILVRPGLDRDRDIGNTYDLFGGRWANQPNRGVDFIDGAGVRYNYDHKEGDTDDTTYGFRWTGLAGNFNYSIGYLESFNNDPVVNTVFNPFAGEIREPFAEFIYPKISTLGFTLSTYSKATDAVWSAEFAYTKDKPFNIGTNFFGGILPGFGGVIEKDTLRSMLRMDKQVDFSRVLGTSRPSLFSVQLFDSWITGFKKGEDIVDLAGYGAAKKEHSTIATLLVLMNYKNDQINPAIAAGYDLSYGGGFFIPSVEFAMGDHWRLRVEADLFFDDGNKQPGEVENGTNLFGYFANNNQLSARLTYQF